MNTILAFGDSLTYGAWDSEGGWVARLRKAVEARGKDWLVYNLGVSGDNSRLLLERLENEILPRLKHLDEGERLIIILAEGTNDAQVNTKTLENKIPIQEFKENMKKAIKICKRYTDSILVIGPSRVGDNAFPLEWDENKGYRNEDLKRYESELEKLSQAEDVTFLGPSAIFSNEFVSEDGLHWNDDGHKAIAGAVFNLISAWL